VKASTNRLTAPTFCRATVGKRTFPVHGANLWNELLTDISSAPSLSVCRRQRLNTFLFRRSYPDLLIW